MFELLFRYPRETFAHAEFEFASHWPVWLLALLAVLVLLGVGISLARLHQELTPSRRIILGALQTSALVLVLCLLWRPALVVKTLKPGQNSVAVLLDTSASMKYGRNQRSRLQRATAALEASVLPGLRREFSVDLYAFSGDTVELASLDKVPAPGARSRIGQALLSVLRGARSGVLGAVVLVSDGADNSHELDAAKINEIASFGVPVDTVGVGREVIPEDLELADVEMPAHALPGTRVRAEVAIHHAGAGTAILNVYDGAAILASKSIELPDGAGTTTAAISIPMQSSGLSDLRFVLTPRAGERDLANNVQWRPVVVPNERKSVLYIEGEPRWDYKFIRRALDDYAPIRLVTLLRITPNKFYRQGVTSPDELADGFPADAKSLFGYAGLIIGSYAAADLSVPQQALIKDFVSRRGGSLLMLGGRRGLADGGWGSSVVAEVLPVTLPKTETQPSFVRRPVKVVLTEAGKRSPVTRLVSGLDANLKAWESMPDIADIQHVGEVKPGATVLLDAEFDGHREPLLVRQRYGLGEAFVLATGGTWRWQMQLPHEDLRQETFWRQLLQEMVAGAPSRVGLSTGRRFYMDEGRVSLRADVRTRAFKPAGNAVVRLTATGPKGTTSLDMASVPGEPGVYRATYDAETPGIYRFDATASTPDGTPLGSARAAVHRTDQVAEHFHVEQNRSLLERLAAATGGHYYPLADVAKLPEVVRFSSAGLMERHVLDLWNLPIAFVLLLALKGGEWLLRLRWGRL